VRCSAAASTTQVTSPLPALKLLAGFKHTSLHRPRLFAKMKLSVCMAALAVALCLGSSLVAANDLTVTAAVLDCNDK
jgi:hypothetical protein